MGNVIHRKEYYPTVCKSFFQEGMIMGIVIIEAFVFFLCIVVKIVLES
jgi:hypothetical protein